MASSASTEQWIFTGGSESSRTMSVFLIASASSTVLPLTHSVASEELAIAEPQPNVLNLAFFNPLGTGFIFLRRLLPPPPPGRPNRPGPELGFSLGRFPEVGGF